jgi:hypothetical protein
MSLQRKVFISLLVLWFLVSMFGCVGGKNNAQITPQLKAREWAPKVREMANNIEDYDIWVAGVTMARPWAIVFDPKDNPRRLTGTPDRWTKIEDKKKLDEIIGWVEIDSGLGPPRLLSILGPAPDREFYAYIYTAISPINTRMVDENTIFVYEPNPARQLL